MGVLDFEEEALLENSSSEEENLEESKEEINIDLTDNYVFFRHVLTNLDLIAQGLQNLDFALSAEKSESAKEILSLVMPEEDLKNEVKDFLDLVSRYRAVCEGALKGAAALELQKNLQQLRS